MVGKSNLKRLAVIMRKLRTRYTPGKLPTGRSVDPINSYFLEKNIGRQPVPLSSTDGARSLP